MAKKIIHSRSCPHDCDACEIRWHVSSWRLDNGCLVCSRDRGNAGYACIMCWDKLAMQERMDAINSAMRDGV